MFRKLFIISVLFTSCQDSLKEYDERRSKELDSSVTQQEGRLQVMTDSIAQIPIRVRDFIEVRTLSDLELKNRLKEFVNYKYEFKYYVTDLPAILKGVSEFYKWGNVLNQASVNKDTAISNLAYSLTTKLTNIQIENYPVLRLNYAKIMDKRLWEQDFDVIVDKRKDKNIWFIHSSFYSNKNIKTFHDVAQQQMIDLRFKKVKYVTSKYDDDIETIILESYSDSAIAYFDK